MHGIRFGNCHASRFMRASLLAVFGLFVAGHASFAAKPTWSSAPQIHFDASAVVAARDVTSPEFTKQNPDERLVAAVFQVSSLVRSGNEQQLLQFFYTVLCREPAMRIVDYLPRTTLASDTAGNITVENKTEASNHAGVSVSAPNPWPVKLSGNGELGTKTQGSVKYDLVPQMIAVTACGTLQRGAGVYFKLKPNRSTSLEGAKEFSLTFRVPKAWRGGCVQLACKALGVEREVLPPLSETVVCGEQRFLIALYADGDAAARAAAARLVRAEAALWEAVSASRDQPDKPPYPTLAHRFATFLEPDKHRLPDDWAEQLVYGAVPGEPSQLEERLPRPVRHAVAQYTVARRELSALGAHHPPQVQ